MNVQLHRHWKSSCLIVLVTVMTGFLWAITPMVAHAEDNSSTVPGNPTYTEDAFYYSDQYLWKASLFVAKSDTVNKDTSNMNDFYRIGNQAVYLTPVSNWNGWAAGSRPSNISGLFFSKENKVDTLMELQNKDGDVNALEPVQLASASGVYILNPVNDPPYVPQLSDGDIYDNGVIYGDTVGSITKVAKYFNSLDTINTVLNFYAGKQGVSKEDLVKSLEFTIDGETRTGWNPKGILPDAISDNPTNQVEWLIVYEPVSIVYVKDTAHPGSYYGYALSATDFAVSQIKHQMDWRYDETRWTAWAGQQPDAWKPNANRQHVSRLAFLLMGNSVIINNNWYGLEAGIGVDQNAAIPFNRWFSDRQTKYGGWGMTRWIKPAEYEQPRDNDYRPDTDVILSTPVYSNINAKPGSELTVTYKINGEVIGADSLVAPMKTESYSYLKWHTPDVSTVTSYDLEMSISPYPEGTINSGGNEYTHRTLTIRPLEESTPPDPKVGDTMPTDLPENLVPPTSVPGEDTTDETVAPVIKSVLAVTEAPFYKNETVKIEVVTNRATKNLNFTNIDSGAGKQFSPDSLGDGMLVSRTVNELANEIVWTIEFVPANLGVNHYTLSSLNAVAGESEIYFYDVEVVVDPDVPTIYDVIINPVQTLYTLYEEVVNLPLFYDVYFDTNGGNEIAAQSVEYDTLLTEPGQPVKEGYTFKGWFKDSSYSDPWNFDTDRIMGVTTLYAKWEISTYIVHFDPQGGLDTISPITVEYGSNIEEPTPIPTRSNYVFLGWFKDIGCNTQWNFTEDTITGDTTLYGKWDATILTVTFDSQGGNLVMSQSVDYDAFIDQPNDPQKIGFTFKGWYQEAACNTVWTFASDRVKSDLTLFAKWDVNLYTVSFDSQGGSAVPDQTAQNETVTTKPVDPTRSGYSFQGWFKDESCEYPWDFAVDTVISDTILYALWSADEAAIEFISNNGTDVPKMVGATDREILDTSMPITVRDGYTFAGWYASADFSGDEVTALPEKYLIGTTIYYAKWTPNPAFIVFETNNGSVVDTMNGVTDQVISPTTMPTTNRAGYTFSGWYRESDFSGTEVMSLPAKYPIGTTTYYAKWTPDPATIEFVVNSGSDVPPMNGVTDQEIIDSTMPTTSRAGYTFSGWYQESDFSGTEVTALPGKYPIGTTIYYAKWTPDPATITFESNSGSNVETMDGVTDQVISPTTMPTTSRAGYTFSGWYRESDFSGTEVTALPTKYPIGTTTYYAKWTADPAAIEFNVNGGSGVSNMTGVTDQEIADTTMPITSKSGYTFDNWYENADFSGDPVMVLPNAFPVGTTRYYAKWTPAPAYLEFNTNGGTAVVKMTGTTDAVISNTTLPTSTRSGYTFSGWYDNAELSGTALSALPSKYPIGTTTFYAKWNPIPHTITFDSKGGSAVTGQTVNHDALITQPATPAKSGYTFSGWYTDASYVTPWSFTTDKVAGDMTLVAKWVIGLPDASVPLQDWSWTQINAVAELGKGQEYFDIGETKTDVVGGETLTFQIYDFNHDVLADGTSNKTNITFGLKDLMATTRMLNVLQTNVGGWDSSTIRGWTNGSLFSQLPGDLQTCIKTVNKQTSQGNSSPTIITSVDKLFLFAAIEVLGYQSYEYLGEGYIYPIFSADNNSRIKKLSNGTGSQCSWWTRSPVNSSTTRFEYVTDSGGVDFTDGNTPSGINFGFALGKATTNTYTVSFDTQGGSAIAAQSATLNTITSEPAIPTKSGMVFDGWYREAECTTAWDFATDKITENTTLFAKWKEEELPAIGTPLADCSWAQIVRVANAGLGDTYWNVGDTKDLTLSTNETVTMQIYGFDHDDKSDGSGMTNITFGTKGLLTAKHYINPGDTNTGGWKESDMRAYLNGIATARQNQDYSSGQLSIYSQMPEVLKVGIKSVNKFTSGGISDQTIKTSADKLFLFSEKETFGTNTYSLSGEGQKYPIFTDDVSRNKYFADNTLGWWWLRSPAYNDSSRYLGLVGGGGGNAGASFSAGVAFGFALGTAPEMPVVGTPLADCTWQQVINVANAGLGDTYWNVGDTKDLTLSTNETVTMQIYGFDHDEKSDGTGTTNITFGTKNTLVTNRAMNPTDSNVGGWNSSSMRAWVNGSLHDSMPTVIKNGLKSVNKKTSPGNYSASVTTSIDKVFLFSEVEIYGVNTYSAVGEGTKYPIFTDDNSRAKKKSDGNITAYWMRSPNIATYSNYGEVNSFGSNINNPATTNFSVCFGFALGNAPYTVIYDTQGGSAVESITAPSGAETLITQPTPPTKAGCEFKGWYKESAGTNVWDFSTDKVSANTTLYAKWEVILPALGTPLSDCTWEQIAKVADQGLGDTYWNVGDTKDMTLSTSEVLTMQIYGFDHDAKADGSGYTNITFGTKDLMATTRQMNPTNTNIGGWDTSALRAWMNGTLNSQLPTELQSAIKPVKKYTSSGNSSGSTIVTSTDSVFTFSERESFGTTIYSLPGEGTKYPIFTDNDSRIKKQSNGAGVAIYHWGRSPYFGSNTTFTGVSHTGAYQYYTAGYTASSSYGVAFGFCLGTAPAIPPIGTTLENCTWEQIKNIADAGMGDTYFNVGDTKNITANGETITMQIYGFDHDEKADGSGIANITFGSKELMANTRAMNPMGTNFGGWNGSDMRTWTNGTLYNSMTSDLKNVIKSVKKLTSGGYGAQSIVTSADKVFAFSEKEVWGTSSYTLPGEGWQYPVFTTDASRIKHMNNGLSSVAWWWLRSPVKDNNSNYMGVYTDGSLGNYCYSGALMDHGICFGFCV